MVSGVGAAFIRGGLDQRNSKEVIYTPKRWCESSITTCKTRIITRLRIQIRHFSETSFNEFLHASAVYTVNK